MTAYTPDQRGSIVSLRTEHGIRYAIEMRGRIVTKERPTMTEAALDAIEYGIEVVQ